MNNFHKRHIAVAITVLTTILACCLLTVCLASCHTDEPDPTPTPTPGASDEFNYLAIGNSITVHGKNEYWFNEIGMAASTADKDYFHIVSAHLKQKHKNATCTTASFTAWELQAEHRNQTYSVIENYLKPELNLITIQLGENAADISTLEEDYYELINYIKQKCPEAQIIIVDDFWHDAKSIIEQKVTETMNLSFASLAEIRDKDEYKCVVGSVVYDDEGNPHTVTHLGVAAHPNDAGMAYIANAIIKLIQD